jgi:small subunit ribosomal protein S16
MLTIRFTRKGKKNQPFFRVVVVDKRRSSKGGRSVEDVGYVDPLKKRRSLDKERILYWISKGAQPSATVYNLLITEKIIEGKKIVVGKAKKGAEVKVETPSPAPASPVAEKATVETPKEETPAPEAKSEEPKV